jgi:hypothetical protein
MQMIGNSGSSIAPHFERPTISRLMTEAGTDLADSCLLLIGGLLEDTTESWFLGQPNQITVYHFTQLDPRNYQ